MSIKKLYTYFQYQNLREEIREKLLVFLGIVFQFQTELVLLD